MKTIEYIDIRIEGEPNTNWMLNYSDGSSEEFYAYEESPRYEEDDSRVLDRDPSLAINLDSMASWFRDQVMETWDDVIEARLYPVPNTSTFIITSVTHYDHQGVRLPR